MNRRLFCVLAVLSIGACEMDMSESELGEEQLASTSAINYEYWEERPDRVWSKRVRAPLALTYAHEDADGRVSNAILGLDSATGAIAFAYLSERAPTIEMLDITTSERGHGLSFGDEEGLPKKFGPVGPGPGPGGVPDALATAAKTLSLDVGRSIAVFERSVAAGQDPRAGDDPYGK